jgi:two-component system response regulator RegA
MSVPAVQTKQQSILVIEDDQVYLARLIKAFASRGLLSYGASTLAETKEILSRYIIDFAVIDLNLSGESGLVILKSIKLIQPECRSLILTGFGTITTAVEAIKQGACHYLTKPTNPDLILDALKGEKVGESLTTSPTPLPSLEQVEWEHIQSALKSCKGNISRAAKMLGLHRRSLQRRLGKIPTGIK